MAVKRAEYMSVESAENFILEHEDSARRLYNRYVRNIKARKLTFDFYKERSNQGYKRLQKAVEISKQGFSAESLSYMAYTLASKTTSYRDFQRIRKETFQALNTQFSVYKRDKNGNYVTDILGRPIVERKFLKDYNELKEFGEFMELAREQHLELIISSDQIITAMQNLIKTNGSIKTWGDLKSELFGMTLEEQVDFLNNYIG